MSKKRDFGEPFKVKIIKDTWKPSTPWYIVDAVDDKKFGWSEVSRMSLPAPVQSMLEDWYDEFYDELKKDNPDLDDNKVAKIAEELTMERLANDGQYDGR